MRIGMGCWAQTAAIALLLRGFATTQTADSAPAHPRGDREHALAPGRRLSAGSSPTSFTRGHISVNNLFSILCTGLAARPQSPHDHSTPPLLSMLDLVAVREGGTVADALAIALSTARHVESLGFSRYWLAEHHNMPGIASSATAVLVGHIAGAPPPSAGFGRHHAAQPRPAGGGRGLWHAGRAVPGPHRPGPGPRPAPTLPPCAHRAPRPRETEEDPSTRGRTGAPAGPGAAGRAHRAVPGAGTNVPIWLLGSSLFSAQLAAHMGLPYAFASHFAPRMLLQALQLYRRLFRPSAQSGGPTPSLACR